MTQQPIAGEVPQWTLADRLRKARMHADLDQADFADQVGISRRSLTNYELGHSTPSRPVLLAWAIRTGVSMQWLQGEDDGGRARQDSNLRPVDYRPASFLGRVSHLRDRRSTRRDRPTVTEVAA